MLLPDDLPDAILHLKLQDISGVGTNMMTRLNRAGITDMPRLWAANAQRLRCTWNGITGLPFHALLHGADLDDRKNAARSISHQHVLRTGRAKLGKARPIIRQLLTRVSQRLMLQFSLPPGYARKKPVQRPMLGLWLGTIG